MIFFNTIAALTFKILVKKEGQSLKFLFSISNHLSSFNVVLHDWLDTWEFWSGDENGGPKMTPCGMLTGGTWKVQWRRKDGVQISTVSDTYGIGEDNQWILLQTEIYKPFYNRDQKK